MGTFSYLAILALFSMGAMIIFAIVSKERTERMKRDPDSEKSALAADTSDHHSD